MLLPPSSEDLSWSTHCVGIQEQVAVILYGVHGHEKQSRHEFCNGKPAVAAHPELTSQLQQKTGQLYQVIAAAAFTTNNVMVRQVCMTWSMSLTSHPRNPGEMLTVCHAKAKSLLFLRREPACCLAQLYTAMSVSH